MAQQSRKAAWARQADIVAQPFVVNADSHGERPVRNEAWVSRLALHPVQRALLPWQQWGLRSGNGDRCFHFFALVTPGSANRLHSYDAPQVHAARLRSAICRCQKLILAVFQPDIDAFRHVLEDDASVRSNGIARCDWRLLRVQLYVHNLDRRASNDARGQVGFRENHLHADVDGQDAR